MWLILVLHLQAKSMRRQSSSLCRASGLTVKCLLFRWKWHIYDNCEGVLFGEDGQFTAAVNVGNIQKVSHEPTVVWGADILSVYQSDFAERRMLNKMHTPKKCLDSCVTVAHGRVKSRAADVRWNRQQNHRRLRGSAMVKMVLEWVWNATARSDLCIIMSEEKHGDRSFSECKSDQT